MLPGWFSPLWVSENNIQMQATSKRLSYLAKLPFCQQQKRQALLGYSAKTNASTATDGHAKCWLIHGEGGMNK